MMWQGIDQRKFPRVNYRCLIKVSRGSDDEDQRIMETHTENIGVGGICVVVDEKFELFETVSIELVLNGEKEPIECGGTVCWVVTRHPAKSSEELKYDVGIEFKDISENDRERISKLVDDILLG